MEVGRSLTAVHVEVVLSLMVAVPTAVGRSLTAEAVHTAVVRPVVAVLTDMVAWVAVAKLRVPAHAPLHSSCAVPRS